MLCYVSANSVIIAGRLKLNGIVAYGFRKTKKLMCGVEGENIVGYGRLHSPSHRT